MTIIEVSKSPPNSKKAEPDEGMKADYLPRSNTPPPPTIVSPSVAKVGNKKVTFQVTPVSGPPSLQEKDICAQVAEIMAGFSQEHILKELRKIPSHRSKNSETTVSEVVEALLVSSSEEEPRPMQGCSPKPVQTDDLDFPPLESAASFRIPMAPPLPPEMQSTSASNENSDLQQAIQLSLQTQKQERSYLPAIPENPEELSRTALPVGLYNVGQTCWFNVIVQELFHIPHFRNLVYHETPDEWLNEDANLTNEARFLIEMRQLFALLDTGNQRVVNPSAALKALEAEYGSALLGHQNDASEMRDRVIAVITRALRQAYEIRSHSPFAMEIQSIAPSGSDMQMDIAEAPTIEDMEAVEMKSEPEDNCSVPRKISFPTIKEDVWQDSPFRDLFHYKRVKRRVNQGGNTEFEAPTLTDTPTLTCDVQKPSLHDAIENHFTDDKTETYLDTLPEVFFVNLNRFCYRDGQGTAKIHTELKIPQKLYMDRYMHRNYGFVKELQRTREGLRHELNEYIHRCNGFEHFPMTNGTAPLLYILNSAKLFISQETAHYRTHDRILPTPRLTLSREKEFDFLQTLEQFCTDATYMSKECIARREELHGQLVELFERPELQKEEYNLHSIIIHEGEADRGHYWAYIRCDPNSPEKDLWQKFNDSGVELVDWQQVHKEAKGNIEYRPGVSAYALCYVKTASRNLLSDANEPFEEKIERLPYDLRDYIFQRNNAFDEEIKKYKDTKEPPPPPLPIFYPRANSTVYGNLNVMAQPLSYPAETSYSPLLKPEHKEEFIQACNLVQNNANFCRLQKYPMSTEFDLNLSQIIKTRLIPIVRERFPQYNTDDVKVIMSTMTSEEKLAFVEELIKGFHNVYQSIPAGKHRPDFRLDPITWWFNTGLGMSSFTFRFMCIRALLNSKIEPLEMIATREFNNRSVDLGKENWAEFEVVYGRIQANYTLLKQLISMIKYVFDLCQQHQKFEENTVNDYFDHWRHVLIKAHLVCKVYNFLKSDLELYAHQLGRSIEVRRNICEEIVVHITVLYPLLKLWRYVLYSIMLSRKNSTAINCISDNNNFNLLSATLNSVAHWATAGDSLSQKVAESFRTVLSMCNTFLPENSIANTTIENLLHSLKPEVTVSYFDETRFEIQAPSVQQEIDKGNCLRVELGFSDEQDSIQTISRLLDEANIVFSTEW